MDLNLKLVEVIHICLIFANLEAQPFQSWIYHYYLHPLQAVIELG